MTDGGKHFDNSEVSSWCEKHSIKHHITAAYTPWINGLVEGTNKILLTHLKYMCAPHLGEDDYVDINPKSILAVWSDYVEQAIKHLNGWVLPAYQFSPKELLLGLIVDTSQTPTPITANELSPFNVHVHSAYVAQQHLDALANRVVNSLRRKAAFDKQVLLSHAGHIIFETGQLVQVYASDVEGNFKSSRKIIPRWSAPWRITSHWTNSYALETLEGWYHARHLRLFLPHTGTLLEEVEKEWEQNREEQEVDVSVKAWEQKEAGWPFERCEDDCLRETMDHFSSLIDSNPRVLHFCGVYL